MVGGAFEREATATVEAGQRDRHVDERHPRGEVWGAAASARRARSERGYKQGREELVVYLLTYLLRTGLNSSPEHK